MRFNVFALATLLPAAGLLSGCAMGTQGVTSAAPNAAMKTIKGKTFGGQQAVADSQIVVYQYGSGGYGSAGSVIASTITAQDGTFEVNYNCTSPSAPVYVLSLGGEPGLNQANNAAIALGAGLGTCAASENGYVNINEISTTILAFSLSHFFSTGSSDQFTSDHFGSPASLTAALSNTNSVLIPTIQSVQNGYPNPSTATFTNETAKIITIADILGACVNSSGLDSPACTTLFVNTTPQGGSRPVNTLEAAVNIGLYPSQNVSSLYQLVPQSGSSAFSGSLATQPSDWTLAVSYTAPTLGLALDPLTVTTLDIDTSGRVWFPSNLSGATGVAYFDPSAGAFSPVFTAPGLVRPEQVAIDINGYVWATDTESPNVAGFPEASPAAPVTLSIPGTTSTALTVDDDNSIKVAAYSTPNAVPEFAAITGENTYALIPNTTPPGSQGYIGASLAGDSVGGTGASATDTYTPNVLDLYIAPNDAETGVLFQAFANSGQVAFTGRDFYSARGGFNASGDGLCVFSVSSCFAFADQAENRHPVGVAIDGGGNVWLSDQYTPDVQEVPLTNGSPVNSSNTVPNQVYQHGTNNGGTMTIPGGIGIDGTGNVWVSNVSCGTVGCQPSAFVLSEVIGAGVPTVTPVSVGVVVGNGPASPSFKSSSDSKLPK